MYTCTQGHIDMHLCGANIFNFCMHIFVVIFIILSDILLVQKQLLTVSYPQLRDEMLLQQATGNCLELKKCYP